MKVDFVVFLIKSPAMSAAASAAPESDTIPALAIELRTFVAQLRRRLRQEASVSDWTEPQRTALLLLERQDGATVTELAQSEGVRSQSMGAIVASLMEANWIKGTPDPADGRRTLLSITPETRKLLRQVRAAREDWLQRSISSRYSASEQRQLAAAMRLLQRLLAD